MLRLPGPHRPPCINEYDFDVQLPAPKDDDEIVSSGIVSKRPLSHPRPIHYHLFMIRAAKIYHHFQSLLKIGRWTRSSIVSLVQQTDDELAQIAFELPSYLKFEYKPSPRSQINEAEFPWLSWQRNNIALVLLHLRVSVNKILQNIWTDNITFQRARSICLNSSTAIISLVLDSGIPREKLKSW